MGCVKDIFQVLAMVSFDQLHPLRLEAETATAVCRTSLTP